MLTLSCHDDVRAVREILFGVIRGLGIPEYYPPTQTARSLRDSDNISASQQVAIDPKDSRFAVLQD
jgi:hypothetical protein